MKIESILTFGHVSNSFRRNTTASKSSNSFVSEKNIEKPIYSYPQSYYISSPKISFGSKTSNYLAYNKEKQGYVPLIVYPGVDLRHSGTGVGAYPEFKITEADFSGGKLDHCYLKNSEITNCNLTDTNMYKIHLHNSNLSGSNFTRAYAPDSIFKYSNFTNANLTDMRAVRSNFQNAKFKNCDLTKADFENANLMGADLSEAKNIDSACFMSAVYDSKTKFPTGFNPDDYFMCKFEKNAKLYDIYLREGFVHSKDPFNPDDYSNMYIGTSGNFITDLQRTKLSDINLNNSKFENIDGQGMSFAGSSLFNTKFINANLEGADFHSAIMGEGTTFIGSDTNLKKTNMIGVDLSEVGLEYLDKDVLRGAFYSNTTLFPDGFDPLKAGMIKMAPNRDFSCYDFAGMSFSESKPSQSDIISMAYTIMKRADFSDCDLHGMNLKGANCTEAYFRGAEMQNTNCENANFLNAKLYGADLSGANLKNTNLQWAKLEGAKIDKNTDFTNAKYNDDTVFPKDFPESKKRTMIYCPRVMASR